MVYKQLSLLLFLGFFLGSVSVIAEQKTKRYKATEFLFDQANAISYFCKKNVKAGVALFGFLTLIYAVLELTNGKNFQNASTDEEMQKALNEFLEHPLSLEAVKNVSKEVWHKIIRMLRSVTGNRQYKIAIKEETIIDADGSMITKKQEQTVPATKLCKIIETYCSNIYPFVINGSIALYGLKEMSQYLEEGTILRMRDSKKIDIK